MGYGIFDQKITGIRDIKAPPNGPQYLHVQETRKQIKK